MKTRPLYRGLASLAQIMPPRRVPLVRVHTDVALGIVHDRQALAWDLTRMGGDFHRAFDTVKQETQPADCSGKHS